jgi:hypothetical protein
VIGRIACDVKVVDTPSHGGNTCAFGFVCNFTNRSWIKPMPTQTAEDLIKCCDELISQDLHGIDVKGIEFVTDNGSAMDSEKFKQYCRHEDRQWKLRYSSAHHQHQNPCEHLWARLNGLCTINISQAAHLGYEYWDHAMCHANQAIQYWPCKANAGQRSPMEAWEMATDGASTCYQLPKHLVEFGKCGYVHEESPGFNPTGAKGYCIGYSYMHARGCYDMLMCGTHRVRKSQNVVFSRRVNEKLGGNFGNK